MKEKGRPLQEGSSVRYVASYHTIKRETKLAPLSELFIVRIKRLAYLTEALYELEGAERAAQAQIAGHALVCPLVTEPTEKPAQELWPQIPNGEAIAPSEEAQAIGPDSYCTASEIEQGQDDGL